MKRVKKIGVGISFPVQLLAWIDKQQTMDKTRSIIVVGYLNDIMEGKNLSLDSFAVPILKLMMQFFLSNKPTKAQLNRFQAMFTPEQRDYIEALFTEGS